MPNGCEEPSPSKEETLQRLGSLETGLSVLRGNSGSLQSEWVSYRVY